jgi:hypothetical protein
MMRILQVALICVLLLSNVLTAQDFECSPARCYGGGDFNIAQYAISCSANMEDYENCLNRNRDNPAFCDNIKTGVDTDCGCLEKCKYSRCIKFDPSGNGRCLQAEWQKEN